MKLVWRIVLGISAMMTVLLVAWSALFHHAVITEVNDETDDALELFSENLIRRVLSGDKLPSADNGTNNTFFIKPVDREYAQSHSHIRYSNEMVYVDMKSETEPARILRTIFTDSKGQYMQLTVATPTVESEDLLEAISMWIVILFSICLLSVIAISYVVVKRSTKPLYRLLEWIKQNDITRKTKPLNNPTNVSEYQMLNDAVRLSAIRSSETYNRQKDFIGNASHELQTPLAVCLVNLEMLSNTALSEEQFAQAMKIRRSLAHLSRLNKQLLLLSKIDNAQFPDRTETNIAALAAESAADCIQIYESMKLSVRAETATPLIVSINTMLASMIVGNIIKNAFVHNVEGGRVSITVENNILTVANTGRGEALHPERIFDRFYQTNKREGTTGLGLSIAQAAAKCSCVEINYRFDCDTHEFSINFEKLSIDN